MTSDELKLVGACAWPGCQAKAHAPHEDSPRCDWVTQPRPPEGWPLMGWELRQLRTLHLSGRGDDMVVCTVHKFSSSEALQNVLEGKWPLIGGGWARPEEIAVRF